jgi:polyhydroxybutyrate depolymerase
VSVRLRVVVLAVALLGIGLLAGSLAAFGGTEGATRPPAPAPPPGGAHPCARPVVAGGTRLQIASGGLTRTAILHLPPRIATGRRIPLVVALHGAGGSGPFMQRYSGFSALADAKGFAVVYPSAVGPHPRWTLNDDNPAAPNDVLFVRDMLNAVEQRVCVDRDRVYAAGVSNGGGLAAHLACRLANRFAAIVSVAGSYDSVTTCAPQRPVSVLEIHGTADGTVAYDSVNDFLTGWAQRDGCAGGPALATVAPGVERFDWAPCTRGTEVEHLRIDGGTHAWPGATPPDPGPPAPISATREAWRFFAAHTRAA